MYVCMYVLRAVLTGDYHSCESQESVANCSLLLCLLARAQAMILTMERSVCTWHSNMEVQKFSS